MRLSLGKHGFLGEELQFRDAPIHVSVDPNNQIAELSKANNVRSTSQEALFTPSSQAFQPKLKWHWSGSVNFPSYNQVMMTPVVGRVVDTNGDGVIDQRDAPVVVFTAYAGGYYTGSGVIRVVDGASGIELLAINGVEHGVGAVAGLALADLDNDGKPEIIALATDGKVVVFRNDGTHLWTSATSAFVGGLD